MANIFELSNQYREVLEIIQDSEDDKALKDTLDSINDALEDKADGYYAVVKTLESENEAIDREVKRLQERKKKNNNGIERLKTTLLEAMTYTGKTKFKTKLHNYSIRNNAPSLDIKDETKIPKDFYKEQAPKLDRRGLLAHVKANGEFDGVELKQTQSLGVK